MNILSILLLETSGQDYSRWFLGGLDLSTEYPRDATGVCPLYEKPLRGILGISPLYAKREATGEPPALCIGLPDIMNLTCYGEDREN